MSSSTRSRPRSPGVSGQPGTFDEAVWRAMTRNAAHHAIMPLSNPTSRTKRRAADLGLDERPRDRRHRVALRPGHMRRQDDLDQSGQERLRVSRHRARRARGRHVTALRRKLHRRRQSGRPSLARSKRSSLPLLTPVSEIAAINRLVATAVARRLVADATRHTIPTTISSGGSRHCRGSRATAERADRRGARGRRRRTRRPSTARRSRRA